MQTGNISITSKTCLLLDIHISCFKFHPFIGKRNHQTAGVVWGLAVTVSSTILPSSKVLKVFICI